jgi:MFS family permease
MFPIAMNYTACILPRRILTGSIGWIAGFGSAGSALFPFVAGAISSKKGINSLQIFFFQFGLFREMGN